MHPHSGNVQSSKDAQEQATLKNARKSLGAILVLAHQPTDDTNQCAPESAKPGTRSGSCASAALQRPSDCRRPGVPGVWAGGPGLPRRGSPPRKAPKSPFPGVREGRAGGPDPRDPPR